MFMIREMNHVCDSHSKYFASIGDREVVGSSPTGTADCDTHSKETNKSTH